MQRIRLAVIVAGLALGAGTLANAFRPSPVAPVPQPAAILDGVSSQDARMLRDFYAAMADIVVRDGTAADPVCKTALDLRNRHQNALQMAFVHTAIVGKYAGLGDKLDRYLLDAIGDVDVPLTPELRQSAAKAFSAIR
jgi:hypothetical protein